MVDRVTLYDPLSPCLFIICLETLAITVSGNKNIQGILEDKEEIKLEMFADDATAFLRKNPIRLEALLHTADLFSKCSGLEINSEKTEMVSGNHFSSTVATVISSKKHMHQGHDQNSKCLQFTYSDSQRKKLNFEEIFGSIKEKLQTWMWRVLTIFGRIADCEV